MYTRFPLVQKSMTLDDHCARFFKCRKNGEIHLSNDSNAIVEWLDALYLLGLRIHALVTYLLTYAVGSGRLKQAISLKQLKIERKLLFTAYIKSYTGFRLPPTCMTLNDLCERYKVIDSLNAAKWRNTA